MARGDADDRWVEIVIAGVLSVSGLMTSWATYQGSLWDGEQAAHYSTADMLRVMSTRAYLQADARRTVEIGLFNSWLQAEVEGNHARAAYYKERFPADLRPVFDIWMAQQPLTNPGAPSSPFAMAQYSPEGLLKASQFDGKADAAFQAGQEANRTSDLFTRGGVFLATAMFFGGIGQVFKVRRVRLALLAVAVICCAIGLLRIITLPVLAPG
jgi:hypothetical protein